MLYYKVISEQKSAPLTLSLIKCNPAKSVAILRQKNLSRTICRGEQCSPVLRICCKFRIVGVRWDNFVSISKCCYRGFVSSTGEQPVLRICCKFRIVGENFLLPNLVVTVGLLLRRANTVRPCSGFAVNSELSGRIFCCRTLLLPWVCFFDGRTVFAPTHTSS